MEPYSCLESTRSREFSELCFILMHNTLFWLVKMICNVLFWLLNHRRDMLTRDLHLNIALRKKWLYSELFWSAIFPHFAAFGLNTERYKVGMRENVRKMRMRITPNTHTFYAVLNLQVNSQVIGWVNSHVTGRVWKNTNIRKLYVSYIFHVKQKSMPFPNDGMSEFP